MRKGGGGKRKDLFGNGRILNGGRFFFVKTAVRKRYERKLGEKEWEERVRPSVDKGMKAKTDTSGRKTGGIIALIDQPDNSISICVIQMVFNFPQRYLHSSIYISFVRNRLAPCFPLPSSPPRVRFTVWISSLSLSLSIFFKSFKNCGLLYLHVVNFSSKLFPSRPIETPSNVPILNIYVIGLFV